MTARRASLRLMVVVVLAAAWLAPTPGRANGRTVVVKRLSGAIDHNGLKVELVAEIDPLLFALGTVLDKYRVVRIKVRNRGDGSLRLSAAHDRAELEVSGRTVPAILDLAAHDPATWDRLPADVRTALAYPAVVERREEESVILYVAEPAVDQPPDVIRYSIEGLGEVVLRASIAKH